MMLSLVGFKTEILCLLVCLLIPTQASDDKPTEWMLGKHTCGPIGNVTRKEDGKMWNQTYRYRDEELPTDFDLRDKFHMCESIRQIEKEQVNCDTSSWAIAVATMLTDRLCIENYGNKSQLAFSITDMFSCCDDCVQPERSCSGQPATYMTPRNALEFWAKEGVVTQPFERVYSYEPRRVMGCKYVNLRSTYGSHTITDCEEKCDDPDYKTPYKEDKRFGKGIACMYHPLDIKQVQIEIYRRGPVATSLDVTINFQKYKSGIYTGNLDTHQEVKRRVVVKIIGWGTEGGTDYWLAANCWGEEWGEEGFFKILRGANVRGFENQVYTGYFSDVIDDSGSSASILNSPFKFIVFTILFCFLKLLQ